VIFLAVGFETTSPAIALTLLQAYDEGIQNLYFLNSQKESSPALRALLQSKKVQIHGFILPGHVCTILGKEPFSVLSPGSSSGLRSLRAFEPLDLLQAVLMLVNQIERSRLCRDSVHPVVR